MKFKEGDLVVVPGCGVGRIEALEKMEMEDDAFEAYRIDLGPDAGLFWVPTYRVPVEGIRPPMDEERVQRTWELIASTEAPKKRRNWNQRQRRYTEMLMSNRPTEMATLLGELAAVRARKRTKKQTLSFGERKILDRVKGLLVEEIATATGKDLEVVEREMTEMVAAP